MIAFRGSATGFKIGDLLKLGDVRGNNRVSLLDFVVRDLAPKHPSMQFAVDGARIAAADGELGRGPT